jgi:hypothetical protein
MFVVSRERQEHPCHSLLRRADQTGLPFGTVSRGAEFHPRSPAVWRQLKIREARPRDAVISSSDSSEEKGEAMAMKTPRSKLTKKISRVGVTKKAAKKAVRKAVKRAAKKAKGPGFPSPEGVGPGH